MNDAQKRHTKVDIKIQNINHFKHPKKKKNCIVRIEILTPNSNAYVKQFVFKTRRGRDNIWRNKASSKKMVR